MKIGGVDETKGVSKLLSTNIPLHFATKYRSFSGKVTTTSKKNADREWFSFLSFRVLPMQMSLIKMSVAEEGVSLLLSWRLRTYVHRLARFISERRRKFLLEKKRIYDLFLFIY